MRAEETQDPFAPHFLNIQSSVCKHKAWSHPLQQPPQQYLASLPEDRREVIAGVRKLLLDNLPAGIEENMNFGMLSYEIPFSTYPDTYNKQPLMFAALAAQNTTPRSI